MQSKIAWPIIVFVAILVGASIPLLFDPNYYFVDDTQTGAFGQWFEIGRRVLEGDWSLVNPRVWQSGNYLSEGAWGIFSPLLWIVGIGAHLTTSALLFSTVVKIVCLVVGGLGVYALARNFGALRPWAALVAVAAPLTGFTLYVDAPSWVNGLMAWSLLPIAWVLARRAVFAAKSPLLAIAAAVTLVGIGYVHATIFLGITLAATIVEAILTRSRPSTVRAIAMAAGAGLFAVIVHLPGLLTAPVTGRSGGVANNGLLTVNISGLIGSATPVGTPSIRFFDTAFPYAPLLYIAWFLPFLAFVDWRALLRLLRARLSIVVVLVAAIIGVLLPSDFGPLRFPVRLTPYLALAVLLIVAIALSHARAPVLSRTRFAFAAGYVLVSAGLTFSSGPQYWKVIALCTGLSLVAVWVAYRILSSRRLPVLGTEKVGLIAGRGVATVAWMGIALTVVMLIPQHYSSPRSPLPNFRLPNQVSDYQQVLDNVRGDTIVAGNIAGEVATRAVSPDVWKETLVGNLWYVTPAHVQNAYSAVYYNPYNLATCMRYNGTTCGDLSARLFEKLPGTGKTLADLTGVSNVQSIKQVVAEADWSNVPPGWSVAEDTKDTRLISRTNPVPGAGSVVWASSGTQVKVVHENAMGVTFRVDKVGSSGGEVALSRIPWPGYQVEGGTIAAKPVEGFLLGVNVDAAQRGHTVTVSYWSPGWPIQLLAGGLLVLLMLGWPTLRLLGRSRGAQGRLGRLARASREPASGVAL